MPAAPQTPRGTPLVLPVLHGPRVMLRAFTPADVVLIQSASRDPLIPLITSVPSTSGEREALAFIERQHHRLASGAGWSFAVADAATGAAVGQIGLWPGQSSRRTGNPDTIGYWIGPEHRKQGYAGEALKLLTEWGMTVRQMTRIELYIEPWNEGSWRTAESAGYRRDRLLPSWQKIGTQWRDMYRYLRTAEPAEIDPRKPGSKIG
ncbi:GNAT family N-acetyltransferase [Arthrobacter citreus]|uniref:GNAT family N-acetyltransferase n=1 Tax=Arthrobacter TaxID=1663 RepID=UPI0012649900|nr:GNAT family protein [Arthrobacter gandavensis]